jgi:cyclophilin family peptidyl-prolyl cis-trans isomerase
MKHYFILILIALSFFACKDQDEATPEETTRYNIVKISTTYGDMYAHLYDSTPLHKANFEKLTNEGFYNQTEFHRVVKNFVIQGGDPNSKDDDRENDGNGGPGYTTPAEINASKFKHIFGAIGAARLPNTVNPARNSSGSQFYIVTNPNGTPNLDGEYTVFGELLGGADVALAIQEVEVNNSRENRPVTRLPMTVELLQLTEEEIQTLELTWPPQQQ